MCLVCPLLSDRPCSSRGRASSSAGVPRKRLCCHVFPIVGHGAAERSRQSEGVGRRRASARAASHTQASIEQTELTPALEVIKLFQQFRRFAAPLETFEGLPKSFDCQRPFRVWCGRRRTSGVLLVSMLLSSRRMWL